MSQFSSVRGFFPSLPALLALFVGVTFSSCAYESSTFGQFTCEEGESAPGKECRDGVWVTTGGENNTTPGLDDGMPPVGDMDLVVDMPDPTDMDPPLDMEPPRDMEPPVDMPDDMGGDMGCVPETNAEFCARVAPDAECGVVPEALDNCGDTRSSVQCSQDVACQPGFTCDANLTCVECTAESDAELCMGRFDCGTQQVASPACGGLMVQVECGSCSGDEVCEQNTGTCCAPSSEQDLCMMSGAACGMLQVDNGCGQMVTVDCGGCGQDEECNGNMCVCPTPSCQNLECGEVKNACNGTNNCGSCNAPETCGTDNMCSCDAESDAELCMANTATCGTPTVMDSCGVMRTPSCGVCAADQLCLDFACQNSVTLQSPSNINADSGFGRAVAIDGNTVVIGAPFFSDNGGNNNYKGRAFIYNRDPSTGVWSRTTQLAAPGVNNDDLFGQSVDVDEAAGRIVVGEPGDNIVRIFERDAQGSWSHTVSVTPTLPQNHSSGRFGWAVSLDGDRIIVGDPTEQNSSNDRIGSVYAFHRTGNNWNQRAVLNLPGDVNSRFGYSVSLDGNRFAVGAPVFGQVYVYEYRPGNGDWDRTGGVPINGSSGDVFGFGVALDGVNLAIGMPDYDDDSGDEGAVSMRSIVGTWSQSAFIDTPSNENLGDDAFGRCVALEGDTLIVGRPGLEGEMENVTDITRGGFGGLDRGSRSGAEVFRRSGGNWSRIRDFNPMNNDTLHVGYDVDISGEYMVIGAPSRDGSQRDRFYIIREQ
jgi:hypothetical protein